MSPAHPALDRFVGRVRRRWVIVRIAEQTGLGLVGGAVLGFAMLLLPLFSWRSAAGGAWSSALLAAGGAIGFVAGAVRRPSLLRAAIEADRQLGLHDMLGTAWSLRDAGPIEPWSAAVLALAEQRCRTLRPQAVVARRLGPRTWGGIGLATAATMAAALFAGSPAESRAAAGADAPAGNGATWNAEGPDRPLLANVPAAPGAAIEHDDPDTGAALDSSSAPQPADPAGHASVGDDADSTSAERRSSSAGSGRGFAQSRAGAAPAAAPHDPSGSPREGDLPTSSRAAVAAAGAGLERRSAGNGADAGPAGRSEIAAHSNSPAAPWKTEAWPGAVRRAQSAIDSGQVAPAYQEMVRRYFDRP